MMKNNFYLVIMTALTLTGCSQNEILDTNPDAHGAIEFGVYTGKQTRGIVTDNSTVNGTTANGLKVANKGFGTQAYMTAADYGAGHKNGFMDNVHVTWNATDNKWEYSPVKFWPNNSTDKISFFAYAPYTDAANAVATGITLTHPDVSTDPKLSFALQKDAQQNMVDLVVSEPKTGNSGTINQTFATAGSSVGFNFKHVLTRVAMKAKTRTDISGSDNLTKVIINEVSIEHSNVLYSKADLNMKTLAWDSSTEYLPTSYKLESYSDATKKGIMNYVTDFKYGNVTYNPAIDISTDKDGVNLFPSNQYLFLIPVGNEVGTGNAGDVSVKIKYSILTKASASSDKTSISIDTKTVQLPAGLFKKGAAYELMFTITLNAIELNVTDVEGWTSTSQDITVS